MLFYSIYSILFYSGSIIIYYYYHHHNYYNNNYYYYYYYYYYVFMYVSKTLFYFGIQLGNARTLADQTQ